MNAMIRREKLEGVFDLATFLGRKDKLQWRLDYAPVVDNVLHSDGEIFDNPGILIDLMDGIQEAASHLCRQAAMHLKKECKIVRLDVTEAEKRQIFDVYMGEWRDVLHKSIESANNLRKKIKECGNYGWGA